MLPQATSIRAATTVAVAAAAAAAAALAAAVLSLRRKAVESTEYLENEDSSEELLDIESSKLMMLTPSVGMLTFYSSSITTSAAAVEAHLRRRLQAIFALNPWLGGRLTQRKGKVHLVYPRTTAAVDAAANAAFQVIDDTELHDGLDYAVLNQQITHLKVKHGAHCVDAPRHEPLLKVVLIRTRPKEGREQLALYLSASHQLVDGHDFYALFSMLGTAGVPASLVVKRRQTFSREMGALMGFKDRTSSFFASVGATWCVYRSLLFARRARAIVQTISDRFVDRRKAEHKRAATTLGSTLPPFVSTNDVITQTLLQRSGCTVGLMAVNFRGKIPGLTDQHAGNYAGFIQYQPADVGTPADIRLSVTGPLYRRLHHAVPFPSSWWWALSQARVCMVTSWVSLYKDAALPGCEQTVHLPIFPSDHATMHDLFVIYKDGEKNVIKIVALTRTLDKDSLARVFSDVE